MGNIIQTALAADVLLRRAWNQFKSGNEQDAAKTFLASHLPRVSQYTVAEASAIANDPLG